MRQLVEPPKLSWGETGRCQLLPSELLQAVQLFVSLSGTSSASIWPLTMAQLPPVVLRPDGCHLTPVDDHHHELGTVPLGGAVGVGLAVGLRVGLAVGVTDAEAEADPEAEAGAGAEA